jgi:hypothetical protein
MRQANILRAVSNADRFKSARVVLFDLHGEYAKAFGDQARVFRVGANIAEGETGASCTVLGAYPLRSSSPFSMGLGYGTPMALLQCSSSYPPGSANRNPPGLHMECRS